MPSLRLSVLALSLFCSLTASAGAAVPHTVGPGETLWSIAAASNFTTRSLAAYNGLPADGNVVIGSTIQIPSVPEAASALSSAGITPATSPASSPSSSPATGAPAPMGGYIVRPGDTLSALAAQSGVSVAQMAYMNGLSPDAHVIAGTALKLPTGSSVATSAPATTSAAPAAPSAAPYASGGRLSSSQVGSVAASQGVPASLAQAISWQESGFNNSMVSSAGARGAMQVMPGTWSWVQQNLTSSPLDPSSPTDNVKAGSLYLGQLLHMTGGDVSTAVAGYYQGLSSVQAHGMLPETQRYVANVLALRSRFGG